MIKVRTVDVTIKIRYFDGWAVDRRQTYIRTLVQPYTDVQNYLHHVGNLAEMVLYM